MHCYCLGDFRNRIHTRSKILIINEIPRQPKILKNCLFFYRSSNNIGELRRPKSFSRHSRSDEIPNNVLEKMTRAVSRQNSSPSARGVQEQSSTRNCYALIDPYESNDKCQSCSSNQRQKCDKISDLIVTVTHSPNGKTNSYSTTERWPKFLLRPAKKTLSLSEDSSHVTEPCLRDTQLCSQQETCM
jgi:hypothetical protein